jgi:hypothetical protein
VQAAVTLAVLLAGHLLVVVGNKNF